MQEAGGKSLNSLIQGTAHGQGAEVKHVGVDHGCAHVFVAEEFLNDTDVVAVFEQVGGEGVAEGVTTDPFGDAGLSGGGLDGFLESANVEVWAAQEASSVRGQAVRREDVLPEPFAGGVGILAVEG